MARLGKHTQMRSGWLTALTRKLQHGERSGRSAGGVEYGKRQRQWELAVAAWFSWRRRCILPGRPAPAAAVAPIAPTRKLID